MHYELLLGAELDDVQSFYARKQKKHTDGRVEPAAASTEPAAASSMDTAADAEPPKAKDAAVAEDKPQDNTQKQEDEAEQGGMLHVTNVFQLLAYQIIEPPAKKAAMEKSETANASDVNK